MQWGASLPFVLPLARLVRAAPIARAHWARNSLILLVGTAEASVLRALLDPALAIVLSEPVPPFLRGTRVLAAFGSFLAIVGMLHAAYYYREMREREREASRLAQSLAAAQLAASEARLAVLRAQLQPHFLFNTLNAVTALLHVEPDVADRMLTRLADLLRSILRAPPGDEHPLGDELTVLDQYLDLMSLRFGPRLTISRAIDAALLDVAVPWLVLQPLAENALEHGIWPRSGPGTLTIGASRDGDRLRLTVEDDGVGIPSGASADAANAGIGLANTRRRLVHLHGERATLTVRPRSTGGTCVALLLPLRRVPAPGVAHA